MDIQTGLVCVGLVILSGAVLLLISMFGMQEKTYEEAIAEQRKMPDSALILGRPSKDKSKDKKQKKQGKKVKEKVKPGKELLKTQSSTETDNESVNLQKDPETHVNFVTPEAEIVIESTVVAEDKKKKKKEKVKPILVNKNEQMNGEKSPILPTEGNHFEEIMPKDDLELFRAHSKSDINETDSVNQDFIAKEKNQVKSVKTEQSKQENGKASKALKTEQINDGKNDQKNQSAKPVKVEKAKPEQVAKLELAESVSTSSTSLDQSPVLQLKGQQAVKEPKPKKTKKPELSLQQMTDRDGVNIHNLRPLIQKAELSRSEVQDLTDLLLNKHLDSDLAEHSEWSEGRQDPVVKLKKQLAEKEKALSEEQEAAQACHSKLKELRTEYNAERTKFSQGVRRYEETIMARQSEIQGLHARLQHVIDTHVSEKQALTQKLQQLQGQVNENNMVIRKMQEDLQAHNALQQDFVSQRQQLDMHVARLSEQHQETENNLKAQLHAQLKEIEQLNGSLNAESQTRRRYEEDLEQLTEQHMQSQTMMKTLESHASHLKESTTHNQELTRAFEELQRNNKDTEKRLQATRKAEEEAREELKFEKTRLQNEVHSFTNRVSELQTECDKLKKERSMVQAHAQAKSDVDKEVQRLREENQRLISQVSSFTKFEVEAQQLKEENESLAAQLTAFTERPATEGRENGDSSYSEEQKRSNSVETKNNENELKKKEVLIEKLNLELEEKQSAVDKLKSEVGVARAELTQHKTDAERLQRELEEQRSKNNDLRQKNWKAMEALNTAEKSLESRVSETERLINDRLSSAVKHEQQTAKELLERLFPNVQVEDKVYGSWVAKFEKSATAYLNEASNKASQPPPSPAKSDSSESDIEKQNAQLQALVAHYKTIIEDTEGMLNMLQTHIEQEEIRWSEQLAAKDKELETLRSEKSQSCTSEQLLKELQAQLAAKEAEREESVKSSASLKAEYEQLKQQAEDECKKTGALVQDKVALTSKLTEEVEKIKELNKEIVKLRSNLKIGQDSYADEHKRRLALEEQLQSLSLKNNHQDGGVAAGLITAESSPSPNTENTKKLKSRKHKNSKSRNRLTGWFRKIGSSKKKRRKTQ